MYPDRNLTLMGEWTYQSIKKDTLDVWAKGELEIYDASLGAFSGKLTLPAIHQVFDLTGSITYGNPFEINFRGIGGTPDVRDMVMDYKGYLVLPWLNGRINTNPSIVGSVVRAKDNQFGPEGYVALWIAVKVEK